MGTLCIPKFTDDLILAILAWALWDSSWARDLPFSAVSYPMKRHGILETLQTLLCPTVWEPPNHEQLPIFVHGLHGPVFLEQGGASNPISGGTIYWWECWLWFRGHQLRMSARRGGAFTTCCSPPCLLQSCNELEWACVEIWILIRHITFGADTSHRFIDEQLTFLWHCRRSFTHRYAAGASARCWLEAHGEGWPFGRHSEMHAAQLHGCDCTYTFRSRQRDGEIER